MRNKDFRKHQEMRTINRRKKIIKEVYHQSDEDMKKNKNWDELHKLSKRKIHCSCPMCSAKTNRDGFKHRDKVNLLRGVNES